jgi:hypothetical protein
MSRSTTTDGMASEFSPAAPSRLTDAHARTFVHSVSDPVELVRANVPFFPKRRPINAFGFGGLHLRAGPDSTVSIARISETYRASNIVDQLTTFNPSANIDAFISRRIDACESANDALLWSAVRVRRAHNQAIDPGLFAANAKMPDSPEHHLLSLLSQGRETSRGSPSYTARPFDDSQLAQLQAILVEQGQTAALEFATAHALWPFALVLAQAISPAEMRRTAHRFVGEAVSPSALASVLGVLAGLTEDASEESWQEILATNLAHYTGTAAQNIAQMAQALEARGLLAPSHVCRLLAPEPPPFALVGTSPVRPTVAGIQMSQLIAQQITPQFYHYSLFYTMALADFGFPERAHDNCTKLLALFVKEQTPVLPAVAATLKRRLERCLAKKAEGIFQNLWRGVDKLVIGFVHGEPDRSGEAIQPRALPESVSHEEIPAIQPPEPVQQAPVPTPQQAKEEKAEPAAPGPAKKPEEERPRQRSWLGSLASKLNPFKKGIVVELSEHDNEMVWNGTRYVLKGHENDEPEPAPPPPPPAMKPQVPVEGGAAAPPPGGGGGPPAAMGGPMRVGAKARPGGRYVSTF